MTYRNRPKAPERQTHHKLTNETSVLACNRRLLSHSRQLAMRVATTWRYTGGTTHPGRPQLQECLRETFQDVMDIAALGYSYEAPAVVMMADVIRIPFAAERSPFWAD